MTLLDFDHTIFIAGGYGMVGSALVRILRQEGYNRLLIPKREELDFSEQADVRAFMREKKPDVVVVAAAKVGGIYANMTYPADFLYDNLIISSNLIHEAHEAGVSRLLFLGSTCIYPKHAPQPIPEEALLTSPLEPTNEAYALAKIAGVKLCSFYSEQYGRSYISAMPCNLYGPGDNYHAENSHVIPALIRRFHEAKENKQPTVAIWGTGEVYREFLYVDDLARGCVHLLKHYQDPLHINIGAKQEITINALAKFVAEVVGYEGTISHDPTKPDGTPRKKSDTKRIEKLGWEQQVTLREGLQKSYEDFCNSLCMKLRER